MYESPDATTLLPVVGVAAVASGLDAILVLLIGAVIVAVILARRIGHGRNARR